MDRQVLDKIRKVFDDLFYDIGDPLLLRTLLNYREVFSILRIKVSGRIYGPKSVDVCLVKPDCFGFPN